jgi:hypothetical protein
MIFGSLGLLVVAGGLLAAGIAKSSTSYLAGSFVCTVLAGALLLIAYAAARTKLGTAAAATPGGNPLGNFSGIPPAAPGMQPVVMYVPMSQVPAGVQAAPTAAAVLAGNGSSRGDDGFAAPPPFLGYDDMTAEQVVKLISSGALTEAQLRALHDYEAAGAARKTVLDKLERAIS